MKKNLSTLILSSTLSSLCFANPVIEIPYDTVQNQKLQVEVTSEGLVVLYPKIHRVEFTIMPGSERGLTESTCRTKMHLPDEQLEALKFPIEVSARYFPFVGPSFYSKVQAELVKNRISVSNYKFIERLPVTEAVRLVGGDGAFSASLGQEIDQSRFQTHVIASPAAVRFSTTDLKLACDFILKQVSAEISWSIETVPHQRQYQETLTLNQIQNVYFESRESLTRIDSNTRQFLNRDQLNFINGALFGHQYISRVSALNSQNHIENFMKFFQLVSEQPGQLSSRLTQKDLEIVHAKMKKDVTQPVKFSGVAHAK